MLRPLLEKIFAIGFTAMLVTFVSRIAMDGEWTGGVAWGALFALPAAAFVLGVRWCRWLVAAFSVLIGLPWLLVPATLHEVDRSARFWLLWLIVGMFSLATTWLMVTSSKKLKKQDGDEKGA